MTGVLEIVGAVVVDVVGMVLVAGFGAVVLGDASPWPEPEHAAVTSTSAAVARLAPIRLLRSPR